MRKGDILEISRIFIFQLKQYRQAKRYTQLCSERNGTKPKRVNEIGKGEILGD